MTMPKRETIRLPEYDYRSPGYYFITVCTREKAPLLCSIVGTGIGWFAGTFKRFTNRTCGKDLWQPRSYDHVIRDEADDVRVLQYIENNPAKWIEDRYYTEEA